MFLIKFPVNNVFSRRCSPQTLAVYKNCFKHCRLVTFKHCFNSTQSVLFVCDVAFSSFWKKMDVAIIQYVFSLDVLLWSVASYVL